MQAIWNGLTSLGGGRLTLGSLKNFTSPAPGMGIMRFSALATPTTTVPYQPKTIFCNIPNPMVTSVRTIMRDYWPRPNEVMRIRKHGWKKRISTPGGRRIIMRRILKGRYILSH